MSSPIESHAATNDVDGSVEPVASSESVTLSEELRDTVAVAAIEEPNTESTSKHKRKKTSEVWKYFVAKEVNEKGKMVQKLECIYCKQRYKGVMGGPTTSLKRHIECCASIKKAQVIFQTTIFVELYRVKVHFLLFPLKDQHRYMRVE